MMILNILLMKLDDEEFIHVKLLSLKTFNSSQSKKLPCFTRVNKNEAVRFVLFMSRL